MDLKELKEILQILEEKEITEFELEEEGLKLRIRKLPIHSGARSIVRIAHGRTNHARFDQGFIDRCKQRPIANRPKV